MEELHMVELRLWEHSFYHNDDRPPGTLDEYTVWPTFISRRSQLFGIVCGSGGARKDVRSRRVLLYDVKLFQQQIPLSVLPIWEDNVNDMFVGLLLKSEIALRSTLVIKST